MSQKGVISLLSLEATPWENSVGCTTLAHDPWVDSSLIFFQVGLQSVVNGSYKREASEGGIIGP